jgi:uncharacterized protein YkwD
MKNLLILIATILSFTATAQTATEIEMVTLVNQVRTNPKSFIPAVEAYIESAKKLNSLGGRMTNKTTGKSVDNVMEAKFLISFLNTVKPVKPLELSIALYTITKSHANYLDSTKKVSHTGPNGQTLAERTKASGLSVGENVGTGSTATNAMVQLLIDLSSPTKGHRTNIFNPKYTQLSVGNTGNIWVQDFIN